MGFGSVIRLDNPAKLTPWIFSVDHDEVERLRKRFSKLDKVSLDCRHLSLICYTRTVPV